MKDWPQLPAIACRSLAAYDKDSNKNHREKSKK
jgi:hypothetical protein